MIFRRMVAQNHLFLEKKMVSNQKTIFFSRKPKKNKKTIFSKTMGLGPPKDGFFGFFVFFVFFGFFGFFWFFWFSWCFGSKPSFSREKDGFTRRRPPKTIFFSRKRWFYQEKTSKTIFFSRKRWFRTKKTIFFSRKPKKPSFGGPSPIVLEKMVLFFWFFGFLLFVSFLFCCCSLDLARTRMPPAVGPLGGGGGGELYIYIYMCVCVCMYICMYDSVYMRLCFLCCELFYLQSIFSFSICINMHKKV